MKNKININSVTTAAAANAAAFPYFKNENLIVRFSDDSIDGILSENPHGFPTTDILAPLNAPASALDVPHAGLVSMQKLSGLYSICINFHFLKAATRPLFAL